jgi:hypothetical protein
MTDRTVLTAWIAALGLDVRVVTDPSREELWVTPAREAGPLLVVRPHDHDTWEIIHEYRVPAAVLTSQWQAPWDTEPPAAVVDRAAREVAGGFPLVDATTHEDGGDVVVELRTPIFDENLTRQAFVLSLSSVQKAARRFELMLARRAEELAAWNNFEATAEQHRREQQELIDHMVVTGPETTATAPIPAAAATPPGGWVATHTVERPLQAWERPDLTATVTGTIERRVPVQVLERQGEWARVACSNGWSAWVDGRELKAR